MTHGVHPEAFVHPTAILEGDVTIGPRTKVGPFAYLRGPLVIGAGNRINPHVVIGTEPEHRAKPPTGTIFVGDDNVINEFVVIQRGTGDRDTRVGSRCFLMEHAHIAHDCLVEDDVTMAPNVTLAGHCHILEGANLGMAVVLHQFSTVGPYAMVGMGAVVTRDVQPFTVALGNPARFGRLNTHPLQRLAIPVEAFRLEGERVLCEHPEGKRRIDAFAEHVRRKLLPAREPLVRRAEP